MKKNVILSILCAVLLCAFAVPAFSADAPAGPVEWVLPEGIEKTQSFATFDHAKHTDKECVFCHHEGEVNQKCSSPDCHVLAGKKDKLSFYYAWHKGDKSCMGCHKKEKVNPKTCKECHPK